MVYATIITFNVSQVDTQTNCKAGRIPASNPRAVRLGQSCPPHLSQLAIPIPKDVYHLPRYSACPHIIKPFINNMGLII